MELPDRERRPSLRVACRGPRVAKPTGLQLCFAMFRRGLFLKVFLPFQKFYFGLSSRHLSPRLGLMISSEPGCEQQVSFFSESGRQLWCFQGCVSGDGSERRFRCLSLVQVKTGRAFLIPDSLTSPHLPRTHIQASTRLNDLILQMCLS